MHVSATRLLFVFFAATMMTAVSLPAAAQERIDQPIFRASVDLVSVAAVVRDKQGRVVPSLTQADFSVFDDGQVRAIVDFQAESNGPVSVALLIDGSGSMRGDAATTRRIGERLLAQLQPQQDDMALMSFDTRLLTLREFTSDFEQVRSGFSEVDAFGATSVYDAIAGAAAVVADRARSRRALIVVTDGTDNASAYTPEEVGWIASTIDVPVYVLAVGAAVSPDSARHERSHGGALGAIARATGGDFFDADTASRHQFAIGRVMEELRHQYLMAFEPSPSPGLHSLDIRTRKGDLRVRARRWYSVDED